MQNGDFPNASCVECDRNFPLLVSADECAKCPNREMDKQGYCQLKKDYKSDLRKECEEAGRKYVDGKCLPSEKEQQPKKEEQEKESQKETPQVATPDLEK